MRYFFDAHCHIMTIRQPNLMNFLSSVSSYLPDFLTSGALSPSYLMGGKNLRPQTMFDHIDNTLRSMEGPISSIFSLMQKDLEGAYYDRKRETPYPAIPFAHDGTFHFRGKEYDRVALCPLLMDFTSVPSAISRAYYPPEEKDRIKPYAEEMVQGIETYYKENGHHLFDIFPLLGITPASHSLKDIETMLETYVTTEHMIIRGKHTSRRFYGVKVYPPLGYDPWPKDKEERKKVEAIYSFCRDSHLPIITHCDDQGFRTFPTKQAWVWTEPNHYLPVLEHYPDLIIDFAHFGYRYSLQGNIQGIVAHSAGLPSSPWFYQIIDLMEKYPNIYTDFSFSGLYPTFYKETLAFLKTKANRKELEKRIMFGSDFSINLLKMESYSQYYELFEKSPFTDEEISSFSTDNPLAFLSLKG